MFKFTDEQEFIISEGIKWYKSKNKRLSFQYDGNAGTGKSVVMGELIRRMELDPIMQVAAMSYIGSASILMRMRGLLNAKTIHSWLYRMVEVPMLDKDGKVIMNTLLNVPIKTFKFIPNDYLPEEIRLIVIDEAFTVPMKMKKQIERFGIPIVAAGDQGQLPPINDYPAYLNGTEPIYHLSKIMRQGDRTDIVMLANSIRYGYDIPYGYFGNVLVIRRQDLTDDMLMWADSIICGKNSTRDYYNHKVRSILGYTKKLPEYGEKVVCRKNNWLEKVDIIGGGQVALVNGLIGRVSKPPGMLIYNGKMYVMSFMPDLLPNVEFDGILCNYRYTVSDTNTRNIVKEDKYEPGNMFEFAYALTGWIAQGSQWNNVIYIEDQMPSNIQNQLNYVGVTRAVKNLIYVKG